MYMYTDTSLVTPIVVYIHACMVYIYIYIYIKYIHIYVHIYIYIYIHTCIQCIASRTTSTSSPCE